MGGHEHTHEDRDWTVVVVDDPEDGGQDFAYTSGLAGHGLPELHLWGRPPEGEDPEFNHRDLTGLLNDLAQRLVEGSLGVGDTTTRALDGGLVSARFRLGTPVPALTLDAGTLPPATSVVPVRWSLHRPPLVETAPLEDAVVAAMTEETREVLHEARRLAPAFGPAPAPLPPTWRPPTLGALIDASPYQRFGPLTALVLAHAQLLLHSGPAVLSRLLAHAWDLERDRVTARSQAELVALARLSGRHQVVDRVLNAAPELVRLVTGPDAPGRWAEVLGPWLDGFPPGVEREGARDTLTLALEHTVKVVLAGEALADVAPPLLRAHTLGPWAWARCERRADGSEITPGPLWQADRAAVAWVGDRLAALAPSACSELGARLRRRRRDPKFGDLVLAVQRHRITGPCSPPGGEFRTSAGSPALPSRSGADLRDVAGLLLIGVTVPDRLGEATWQRLVEPLLPVAPALEHRPETLVRSA